VFRHIYLDERSIRFKADPTKRDAPKKGEAARALDVEVDGEPLEALTESRLPRSRPSARQRGVIKNAA
jgi:hypothetical protein